MIEKRSDKGTARLTGNILYPAQQNALLIKQANYAREENGLQSMIVVYGEGKKARIHLLCFYLLCGLIYTIQCGALCCHSVGLWQSQMDFNLINFIKLNCANPTV